MDDLLYLGVGIALFLATLWFVRGGDSTSIDLTGREPTGSGESGVRP